ncbi:hypothetical protein J6590_020990 [Homalodisca vitripennis]|nr:hypothetical protein J6590_020990 [Homalodisca vitripennis]
MADNGRFYKPITRRRLGLSSASGDKNPGNEHRAPCRLPPAQYSLSNGESAENAREKYARTERFPRLLKCRRYCICLRHLRSDMYLVKASVESPLCHIDPVSVLFDRQRYQTQRPERKRRCATEMWRVIRAETDL